MSTRYMTGSLRGYGMASMVVLLLVLGSAGSSSAASMDAYNDALAGGNVKASALEAKQLVSDQAMNGNASAQNVMKLAEQLVTGAVATGDERTVNWVASAVLNGAGAKNFNAAELGVRVVVEGTRYQSQINQVVSDARGAMGVPAQVKQVAAVTANDAPAAAQGDKTFADGLFGINRSSWSFSNRLSVMNDSNLYSNESEEDGMVYKDALSMSLSASSARSAMQVFYKPTLTYSPDKDAGETEVYHDLIGMLSHELSERTVVRLKETFQYREDEDIYDTAVGNQDVDNTYWKNSTEVALDRVMQDDARLSVSATATMKRYTETDQESKDYNLFTLGTSYAKTLSERTFSTTGMSFTGQDYNNTTVDKSSTVFMANFGLNHQLNPDVVLSGAVGAQFVQPDNGYADDKVVPYLNGAVTYYFSPRTTLTGSAKYFYNEDSTVNGSVGSDSLEFAVTGRHNFTEKMMLSASVKHTENKYSDFSNLSTTDTETTYDSFSTRLAYNINRIHSVDMGYVFRTTDTDTSDYDRQQIDLGWTVKF